MWVGAVVDSLRSLDMHVILNFVWIFFFTSLGNGKGVIKVRSHLQNLWAQIGYDFTYRLIV